LKSGSTFAAVGSTIEDRLGSGRYIVFYLACGIDAALTHVIFNPTSTVPVPGPSGAIAGIDGRNTAVKRSSQPGGLKRISEMTRQSIRGGCHDDTKTREA